MNTFYSAVMMAHVVIQAKQYGCFNGESCILSSQQYTFMPSDTLYCTSSIKSCNIYCLSANSCKSVSIYSSAQSTTIICNATQACYDATIRIGDTSIYPMSLTSDHFIYNEAITNHIDCASDASCSFLTLYFDGTQQDVCSLSATNTNAFYNGYFGCNLNIDDMDDNNAHAYGCKLLCGDMFYTECLEATLYCNTHEADDSYCKCSGNVCDVQKITIYPDDISITTTISTISPDSSYVGYNTEASVSSTDTSLFESIRFKLILIALIIIIILLGCLLLICCWQFDAIYDFIEEKKQKSTSRSERVATQESMTHVANSEDSKDSKDSKHSKHDDDDEEEDDGEDIKYAMGKFPATWYKYKTHKDDGNTYTNTINLSTAIFSPESVISVLSELSAAPDAIVSVNCDERRLKDRHKKHNENMDVKQNRIRHRQNKDMMINYKKPTKQNKRKHVGYKKVKMKRKAKCEKYDTDSDTDSTESEAESDSTDASTETDSVSSSSATTATDSDSGSGESTSSSEEAKDGDADTQTKDLLNVDDMVANMVMFIQNTPKTNIEDKNKKIVTYDDIA